MTKAADTKKPEVKIAEPLGEQVIYNVGRTTVGNCSNCNLQDELEYIKGLWICTMCNEYGIDRKLKTEDNPDMVNIKDSTFY